MIFKYQTNDGSWGWFSNVSAFKDMSAWDDPFEPYPPHEEMIDEVGNDEAENLHMFRFLTDGVQTLLIADVKQAFLVSSDNGSTIDIVVRP